MIRETETDRQNIENSHTGSSVIGWWEYEAALRVNCVSFQSKKKFIKITKKKCLHPVERQQCSFKFFKYKNML